MGFDEKNTLFIDNPESAHYLHAPKEVLSYMNECKNQAFLKLYKRIMTMDLIRARERYLEDSHCLIC